MIDHAVCIECDQPFDPEELVNGRCFLCRLFIPTPDIRAVAHGVPV